MTKQTPSTRLTQWLIAWRRWLLAFAVIPLVLWAIAQLDDRMGRPVERVFAADGKLLAGYQDLKRIFSGRLTFDRSIENMFAPDDPLLEPYQRLKRTFGGNEIIIAAYTEDKLFEREGIERIDQVSAQIEDLPGVEAVLTLLSPIGDRIIDEGDPLATRFRELFEGYTHGADMRTAAVVCMLTPESQTDQPREETIVQLRKIVADLPSGTIAGEPAMVVDGFAYIEEDGQRLAVWTTGLLIAVIFLCFRSIRWVIIPMAVVQFALLGTRTWLVANGQRLSMVSSMLTAIVTVVGIAGMIHVIVRFRDARTRGGTPATALLNTGTLLAVPILLACMTDAVGFLSLWVAKVGPVQDFGTMMATGALLVIFSVAFLVPGLTLWGSFDPDPKRAWGEARLDGGLRQLLKWVEHRPKSIALGTLIAAGTAAAGNFFLNVETDFTKNFRSTSPIVRSYEFVENRLGGAGVWDVIVPAPERLDWNYFKKVLHLEHRLRNEVRGLTEEEPGLTKVLSLADAVVAGSLVRFDSLPLNALKNAQVNAELRAMQQRMPVFYAALVGEDPQDGRRYLRIMLRAAERQPSEQKQALIADVDRITREVFPDSVVTGYFVLLTNLIDSMIRDQWNTFAVASAGIALMMLLAFRSITLAVVALIPNVLPIILVLGLMGWLGVKINMGAAMIAAVSMGLSIDSSIHYIHAFLRARRDGLAIAEALDQVQQHVGRAMFFSTLALIVGFSALMHSQFVPTIYFGILVSLAMLGGLIGNLVVLPLLLRWVPASPRNRFPPQIQGDHRLK